MSIRSDAKNGHQYRKWLFALSEILCKIGIGFISNFLLKVRVLYLTILKRKNLSLPLKVETDQFVICLVSPECLSVKICHRISPSNSEANRDGAVAESLFPSFFSFSTSFKNSRPREKVGNCLRFGTGGWSLCFYPLWWRNISIFFPTLTMATRAKNKFLAIKNWFMLSVRISSYGCTREVWRARKKRKSCSRRSREQL